MVHPEFPFHPSLGQHRLFTTGLRFLFACYLLQTVGCLHHQPEPTTPASKPGTSSPAAGPQRAEQSEKDKLSEKRPSAQKEKKTATSAEKKPSKKPDQPDESVPDMPAPPPPLKPPTFGGAGG